VANWFSNGLIVSALASSVKLASRMGCSFCNYRLLKGFILYRNLLDFLLRLIVLKRPGFQPQKYGMPIYTSIVKGYTVCFWIRDSQRYSKTSYISMPTKYPCCAVVSHMCNCKTITVLRKQPNNLSSSTSPWVECQREAVNHLSRSLKTWKMLNIIWLKLKFIN